MAFDRHLGLCWLPWHRSWLSAAGPALTDGSPRGVHRSSECDRTYGLNILQLLPHACPEHASKHLIHLLSSIRPNSTAVASRSSRRQLHSETVLLKLASAVKLGQHTLSDGQTSPGARQRWLLVPGAWQHELLLPSVSVGGLP